MGIAAVDSLLDRAGVGGAQVAHQATPAREHGPDGREIEAALEDQAGEAVDAEAAAALGGEGALAVGVHRVDHPPLVMDGDRYAPAHVSGDEVQRFVGPAQLAGVLPCRLLHVQGVGQALARQFLQPANAGEVRKFVGGNRINDETGHASPLAKLSAITQPSFETCSRNSSLSASASMASLTR